MTDISTITGPPVAPERRRLPTLFMWFAPYASILFGVLAVALIWFGAFYNSSREMAQAEQSAFQNADNLARALEEHTIRALRGADQVLRRIRDDYEKRGGHIEASLWSRPEQALGDLSFQVAIIGRNGMLAASNIESDEAVNLADREHFRVHAQRAGDELFISKPVVGRVSGRPSIQLTRRIAAPDGSFGGVAVISIDPDSFSNFYETINVGAKGTILLAGTDGIVRAQTQNGRAAIGGSIAGSRLLSEFERAKDGRFRATSSADGVERFITYRAVRDYPLLISVDLAVDEVFAPERRFRFTRMLAAGFLTLVLVPLILLVVGYQRWLARARDAAEAGTRARADFLAIMSHEIRTPLNAVLGFATSLLESKLDAEQRRTASALHSAGDSLLHVLNDVLDLSRLDAGRMAFEQFPFSPVRLTEMAVNIVAPGARARGLKLRTEIDPALPHAFVGDAGRLRQVLLNLLSNAVKFTERGEVVVRLHCPDRSADRATVQWSVSDTGIGIAPERIASVFAEFVQADSSVSRRFGGSGLGLAICKRLVDQMGGRIEARSVPEQGSTFSFSVSLPVSDAVFEAEPAADDVVGQLKARIGMLGRPLRILLAEDNPTNQLVGKHMLREFDAALSIASNGVEAVQLAATIAFDVVLMDMQMPEMDGIAAARRIRASTGPQAHVPIVALTANAYPEDVKACLDAGMNSFVAKPVRKAVLVEAILRLLPKGPDEGGPQGSKLTVAATGAGSIVTEQAPMLDRSAVDEFVEEVGTDTANNIFATFFAEAERRLETLRGLSCDDRETIQFEAHTLIGSSGTFGMTRLSQLSRQLERRAQTIAPEDYRGAVEELFAVFNVSRRELIAYLGKNRGDQACTPN